MEDYTCLTCGHEFPSHESLDEAACPRCGSRLLRRNPWLLGTHQAEDLTSEDYRQRVRVTT